MLFYGVTDPTLWIEASYNATTHLYSAHIQGSQCFTIRSINYFILNKETGIQYNTILTTSKVPVSSAWPSSKALEAKKHSTDVQRKAIFITKRSGSQLTKEDTLGPKRAFLDIAKNKSSLQSATWSQEDRMHPNAPPPPFFLAHQCQSTVIKVTQH